jgi:hypothetical protein
MVKVYFGKYFVKGNYQESCCKIEMNFCEFSLGDGDGVMKAKGYDEAGNFTMIGTFDATKDISDIKIVKQYTNGDKQSVDYNGKISHYLDNSGVELRQFKIQGKWSLAGFEDEFFMESFRP